jgi:hypothetical protein
MTDDLTTDAWMLCREDANNLEDVLEELRAWCGVMETGREIIALGAVIAYLEDVLEREEPSGGVRIGWTCRPDHMDGVSVDIAVSDEGIELGQTEFVATGQGNSCDHSCTIFAYLNAEGGFPTEKIARWLKLVAIVRGDFATFNHEITWLSYEG